jgi:hypothetical protein
VAVEEAVAFQSAFLRRAQVERAAAATAQIPPPRDLMERQIRGEAVEAVVFQAVGLQVVWVVLALLLFVMQTVIPLQ